MSTTPPKKLTGLGRGLGALIPQRAPSSANEDALNLPSSGEAADGSAKKEVGNGHLTIPLTSISVNPDQPRVQFKHQELEELMNSIKEHGIIQPLTVSLRPGGGYELIAGERRFRASKMLGLTHVPVTVRAVDNTEKLVLALIENIQREDLNPLEEAKAYNRLLDEFGMTQEQVSKQVGKARSTVANTVRLLDLPTEIQDAISAGIVPAGTARAMLSLPTKEEQLKFFKKMVAGKMTARETEAGVRNAGGKSRRDPLFGAAEEELRGLYGTKVEIKNRKGKGSIIISFYSDEEMQDLLGKLRD